MNPIDHSQCNNAWKPVTCERCGRQYTCTPSDDFYCAAEGDHCCELCLLKGKPITVIAIVAPSQALPTERTP